VSAHEKRVLLFVEDPAASLDRFDAQPACEDDDTARRLGAQLATDFLCPLTQCP
jgi:hypothetical protein